MSADGAALLDRIILDDLKAAKEFRGASDDYIADTFLRARTAWGEVWKDTGHPEHRARRSHYKACELAMARRLADYRVGDSWFFILGYGYFAASKIDNGPVGVVWSDKI